VEFAALYRYLGVEVTSSGTWSQAVESLSAAGLRACHALRQRCMEIHLYDRLVRVQLFDSLVLPILMHGAEVWGASSLQSMSSFGDQERDPTEQVHRSFFRSLLGVRASTPGISILGEFGRFPLLVRRVRAILLYYNRLIGLRGSGRLCSLAFEDSMRLWEEWEFMHDTAALPGTQSVPRVRGWYGDVIHMLGIGGHVRFGSREIHELDIPAIVREIQHQYLSGPHRLGPDREMYDRLRDTDDYSCALAYIRTQYFTEAYRTLARFRTGSHHLASVTGRWVVPRDSPSFHTHRLCTLCRLDRIEDEDHFIFECPTYRLRRMLQYPDLFADNTSKNIHKFLGQDQHRVASFIRDCFGLVTTFELCLMGLPWLLRDVKIDWLID
jgi:hypothetical protein